MPFSRIKELEAETITGLLAGLLIFLTIYLFSQFEDLARFGIMISVFGISAFFIFVKPYSAFSTTKGIIGGYILCFVLGYAVSLLNLGWNMGLGISAALAFGLSIILLQAFDFMHPPAIGISIAIIFKSLEIDMLDIFGPEIKTLVLVLIGAIAFLMLAKILSHLIHEYTYAPSLKDIYLGPVHKVSKAPKKKTKRKKSIKKKSTKKKKR